MSVKTYKISGFVLYGNVNLLSYFIIGRKIGKSSLFFLTTKKARKAKEHGNRLTREMVSWLVKYSQLFMRVSSRLGVLG